jgi:uncharacterized membrane protein YkgB
MESKNGALQLAKFVFVCETLVLLGGLLSQITTCFIFIVGTNPCYMPNSHTKPSNSRLVLNDILCMNIGV